MNLEWLKLRPVNGDIKNGFEELVCQLARIEKINDKKEFFRIAAPDGGVEAYCVLNSGDEYGWQGKFFTSMGDSQWKQVDKSFKTAVDKHPRLIKYFVCIPLDRQDPRLDARDYFMDKWNSKVEEWKKYCDLKGRVMDIEYWGNFEIFEKLSKKENEGKRYYWFNQHEFTEEWFQSHLNEAIKNLGRRYTPECKYDLPIAKVFDGLARDESFANHIRNLLDDLLKKYNKAIQHFNEPKVQSLVDILKPLMADIRYRCETIDLTEMKPIDIDGALKVIGSCEEHTYNLISLFYELDNERKKETPVPKDDRNRYDWDIDYARKFLGSLHTLQFFLKNTTCKLANNPFLLFTGEAGIGKSHLLADMARKREERKQFTLLLLGQHFNMDDPWTQILRMLHVDCSRDVFLSALNSKAEENGLRIVIMIDALNEGEGRKLWKDQLPGIVSTIRKYPYLGFVFSLRSSYEDLVLPEKFVQNENVLRVTHTGFAGQEYDASKLFFETYKIKQPSIPLLHPEFRNPLFLRLFCEALEKRGLPEIPEGYEGISAILDFYLDAINSTLSDKHGQPRNLKIVQKIIKKIANHIAETNSSHIEFDIAFDFVCSLPEVKGIVNKSQFFLDLISEGLLTQNAYYDHSQQRMYEGIYIAYERFSDHMIATYLIDTYLNKTNPSKSFKDDSKLTKKWKHFSSKYLNINHQPKIFFELLSDERTARQNSGIIEALSIQLPEMIGMELYELAPHAKGFKTVAQAFIDSIIWRKRSTLGSKIRPYVSEVIIDELGYLNHLTNVMLLVTSHPNHYFNSDRLHGILSSYSMADRDEWWTQYIHNQYPGYDDDVSSIKRMIDWAWTNEDHSHISDESVRLMAQTMCWFLTSSNRTLRDSTTKALICLLQYRVDVLIEILKAFNNVNDPYVKQRVYAVAYGCSIRIEDAAFLKKIAQVVFELVFNTEEVYPDILLRDYARSIIDYAIHRGASFEFEVEKTRPPYKSDLPTDFPSTEEINAYEYDYKAEGFQQHFHGRGHIIDSMKTNTGGQMYGDFGRYTFEYAFDDWRVNPQGLSNLAVKWIMEKYGYDVEKHGRFDMNIGHGRGRNNSKEERIGKKYQWIALFELLARVSDNLPMYEDSYSDDAEQISYKGPWNPNVRDIDPTVLIKQVYEYDKQIKSWIFNTEYDNWKHSDKDWINIMDDIPNPLDIVLVKDDNGVEWLNLERFCSWHEPISLGNEKYDVKHKELWYQIRSYIVHEADEKVIGWAKSKNLMGRHLPEPSRRYELFSREYYWSEAWKTFNVSYYSGNMWSDIHAGFDGERIGEVANTVLDYNWEEEFDASKESTIGFFKPSELIFNLLDLEYSQIEGQLIDKEGSLVCFDPCTTLPEKPSLLIRKDVFRKKLSERGLKVFWTIIGEKQIIGGHLDTGEYVGRLNISGIITFENDELKFSPNPQLDIPNSQNR